MFCGGHPAPRSRLVALLQMGVGAQRLQLTVALTCTRRQLRNECDERDKPLSHLTPRPGDSADGSRGNATQSAFESGDLVS
jgi:hypothetical protein